MKPELFSFLQKNHIPFQKDREMSTFTSFKIGGVAPVFIEPENTGQLQALLEQINKLELQFRILGGGTNILMSDHPDNLVFIRPDGDFKNHTETAEGVFRIGAGALTTPVFRNISKLGYTGAEFLSTIPGRVGGAVIQNAGCYGGELFNLVREVEYIDLTSGGLVSARPGEIEHGYRTTQFRERRNAIITSITIELQKGNAEEIEASLKDKRDKRNSSQPENKKSAGSVFKNPPGTDENGQPLKSWQLIDQAGLRGAAKGDAQISPVHCNFIVNNGKATAADVHYLIQLAVEKVEQTSGIILEKEIEYFGDIP